jgi:hypothetical protein
MQPFMETIWLVVVIAGSLVLLATSIVTVRSFFSKEKAFYLLICLFLTLGITSTIVAVRLQYINNTEIS